MTTLSTRSLPASHGEASRLLGSRDHATIAHNTTLVRWGESVEMRLHGTPVATFHPDESVTIRTGGYETVTTKQRINQALGARGRVFSDRYDWYYAPRCDFSRAARIPVPSGHLVGLRIAADGTARPLQPDRIRDASRNGEASGMPPGIIRYQEVRP